MTDHITAFLGADIFDGTEMHNDCALLVRGERIQGIVPAAQTPVNAKRTALNGGTLAPGFVDLQVNGGNGVMFNDAPTVATLRTIAQAHAGLGATSILPTLITDTPAQVRAAIDAVEGAIAQGVAGIIGLHLEGPHLSQTRKGAHAPSLIRPMQADDLALLLEAARRLPVLKVTIAPESVPLDYMKQMADSGILLSIGHSDATYDQCVAAAQNGARCVTHLFNAMSQLANRAPGLVGAALECGDLCAGLIADLNHVHASAIAIALRAKKGPGRIFLVSDAMATAGSDIDHFNLNGRRITRREGRLTLTDGTLAGADLDLATAIRNVTEVSHLPPQQAIAMATSTPAQLVGQQNDIGTLAGKTRADFIHLSQGKLTAVWQSGARISG